MKITHVISGLTAGGAQTMLYKLLSQMDQRAFAAEVIPLADVGSLDKKIRALGIPVRTLGMRPEYRTPGEFIDLPAGCGAIHPISFKPGCITPTSLAVRG